VNKEDLFYFIYVNEPYLNSVCHGLCTPPFTFSKFFNEIRVVTENINTTIWILQDDTLFSQLDCSRNFEEFDFSYRKHERPFRCRKGRSSSLSEEQCSYLTSSQTIKKYLPSQTIKESINE
jgi:hypothetical protein